MNKLDIINDAFISECEPNVAGYLLRNRRYYRVGSKLTTYENLMGICESEGTQLAMFHVTEDKEVIKKLIEESKL